MKNTLIHLLIITLILSSCKEKKQENVEQKEVEINKLTNVEDAFSIEILDDEALNIIDSNTTFKVLASGFTWVEGPLWVENGNFLLFSDIPNNKVYKLDVNNDTITYLKPSGYTGVPKLNKEPGSNGLALDNDGNLVLMQHGDRRVSKMMASTNQPESKFVTLVDNFEGKKLNSPNDGFYDNSGNLYFTDPPYGLPEGAEDPSKELDFQGVYCLLKSGKLVLLDKLSRPNGITISKDGKKLYVAVSDEQNAVWYAYDIIAPGNVTNKQVFFDVTNLVGKEGEQGLPDGMKAHSKGYLIATGPGGVWIFNKKALPLARIHTGQLTSNCALSTNEKKLFLTADDYILSVDLK